MKKAFPFFFSSLFLFTKQKEERKNYSLTFKTSSSNVDSSTSSTALTASPAERANAEKRAGLRAAGKAAEVLPTRWEGRARPNAAVVADDDDDKEHRAEDSSDAEVVVALRAGLAVAVRLVAVAFIVAIMVVPFRGS